MDKTPKIGKNFSTHKPQSAVENIPFLNGHHSPADRARELFQSDLNGERLVEQAEKKTFHRFDFGLSGYVYKTTGCFDIFWHVFQNNPWDQRPVGVRKSSRITGAKPLEI